MNPVSTFTGRIIRSATALAFAAAIIFSASLTSCATQSNFTEAELTVADQSLYVPEKIEWKEISQGIAASDYCSKEFPVEYHLVKIELKTDGMTIAAYPTAQMAKERLESGIKTDSFFKGISTTSFASQFKTAVALNTTPFNVKEGAAVLALMGNSRSFAGIHKIEGIQFSEPQEKYAALVFSTENGFLKADILDSQKTEFLEQYQYAFGGFFTILRDGEKKSFKTASLDCRTACGISQDGFTVYFLAVEGPPSLTSKGLTYPQCADILLKAGAYSAMQFDGGSSTQMCLGTKALVSANPSIAVAGNIGFMTVTLQP